MGYKREEVFDSSPTSIKKINDNFRYIWMKLFGNISFEDMDANTQSSIGTSSELTALRNDVATKLSKIYFGSLTGISAPTVVTLPAEYQGKDFKVLVSLANVTNSYGLVTIKCTCSSIDNVNGKFTVDAKAVNTSGTTIGVDVNYLVIV